MFERLRGWRTIMLHASSAAMAGTLLTLEYLHSIDLTQLFSQQTALLVSMGISIACIWLRVATTGPVGGKE